MGVSFSGSVIEDATSRVIGLNQGYVWGLRFGVTWSKVATSILKDKTIKSLERKCNNLMSDVDELKGVVASLLKDKVNLSSHS